MIVDPKTCQRCGLPVIYHTGRHFKCQVRKKPYKLLDGVDIKLGMRVWHWHPYSRPEDKIISGTVAFIHSWGTISLRKDPEDQDPTRIFDTMHDGHFSAHFSCFSSLENVEAFRKKREAERLDLQKWSERKEKKRTSKTA